MEKWKFSTSPSPSVVQPADNHYADFSTATRPWPWTCVLRHIIHKKNGPLSSTVMSSIFLLTFTSKIIPGFKPRQDEWSYFCSFQTFPYFEMWPLRRVYVSCLRLVTSLRCRLTQASQIILTPWLSVRKLITPTERPTVVGEVCTSICGWWFVSWSAQRVLTAVNLGFVDRDL
jgi:hypothetical protein